MHRLRNLVLRWPDGFGFEIEHLGANPGRALDVLPSIPNFESAEIEESAGLAEMSPGLCFADDPEGLYETLRLRENTEYIVGVTFPTSYEEILSEWKADQTSAWPFSNPRLANVWRVYPPRYWQTENNGSRVRVWGRVNFSSFVGTVDLSLDSEHSLKAEIASSKIDYYDDFKALLSDVSKDFVDLLFQLDSASGYRFEAEEAKDVGPSVAIFHLRRLMAPDALPVAIETIIRNPNSRLNYFTELSTPAKARFIDPMRAAELGPQLEYRKGGPLADLFRGHTPLMVPDTSKIQTLDTPENRFVKAFLLDLSNRLSWLENALAKANKTSSLREVRSWANMTDEWLGWPHWAEIGAMLHVPSNSQVLFRANGYREVLEADLVLKYALRLPWPRGLEIAGALGDIRPIFELYEYWCYFRLRKALSSVCGTEPKTAAAGLFVESKDGLQVDLRKGKTSSSTFSYTDGVKTAKITLYYNRRFSKGTLGAEYLDASYSTRFNPDFSILVQVGLTKHWLHFDAKYRLNLADWMREIPVPSTEDIELSLKSDLENTFQQTDLNKMHTYRDAILGTRGAYVLFPASGLNQSVFVRSRDPRYRGKYQIPGVGAFPLRPKGDERQMTIFTDFLNEVVSSLVEKNTIYQEELGVTRVEPAS